MRRILRNSCIYKVQLIALIVLPFKQFNNAYRYLNHMFSLNNQEFSLYTAEIYPKKLTVNKSNLNGNNSPFLD